MMMEINLWRTVSKKPRLRRRPSKKEERRLLPWKCKVKSSSLRMSQRYIRIKKRRMVTTRRLTLWLRILQMML